MPTPAAGDLKPARLRLWSNRLWILAAILGAAVLWSTARLIHDQRMRREALRSLAQDKAAEIANLGAAKFRLLIAEAIGPALTDAGGRRDFIGELEEAQRLRVACRCRETLPITRFFQFDAFAAEPFDAGTRKFALAPGNTLDPLPDSALVRIARAELDRGMREATSLTNVEIVRGQAVVTITRPADSSPGTKVFGATMPVAGLASVLFGAVPREVPGSGNREPLIGAPVFVHDVPEAIHAEHIARHRRLISLDTLGMGVSAGSQNIFGAVADRPYMGTAVLPEPLDDFRVYVALMGSQVSLALLTPMAPDRLAWNGILILATIVVSLFAIGSSRREVALARARSDFVAGISHDLRMPLAQILLASETLSLGRDRTEKERSSLNDSILREARRLKALVDNVILFARTGAVGIEPRLQPVELSRLFHAVAESVDLALDDAGQSIVIEAPDDLRAVADRALLHQALVNLLDNSMKYGPAGQRIRLRAERDGPWVRISVEDEGPGIPASARSRLFEPYQRLDRDSDSERTGSGLGLAVVRQIVLACKGDVAIEDGAIGARLVIRLPIAE
ncbi:MAG TPA: HAMP domain-containing sensor histidine kinase [Gemmatimonadaceae bacterium]|nr:HAMP domain-containing sensor histidine kinase [Gemmatimonadaceae bacterium]